MKALIFAVFLVPCVVQASDYKCKGPNGYEAIEANSYEEARFQAQKRWHKDAPCIKGDASNSFDADAAWINQQDLRPFLPPDIKLPARPSHQRKGDADTSSFRCDYSGNFTADGSRDMSRCGTLESASMGMWKIRRAAGYPDNVVLWRLPDGKLDGRAQFWVHKTRAGVELISPEALAYARDRGFTVNARAVASSIGPAGDAVGGQQQAATLGAAKGQGAAQGADAAQDQIKKGLGNILKGIGR